MQVDQIRIADFMKTEDTSKTTTTSVDKKSEEVSELRTISMDSPFYQKNDLQEQNINDQLESDLAMGTDSEDRMNQIAVYANTVSEEDLAEMEEEGFSAMDTDVDTIVTVTDRIKLALAKGGADISSMGGLDEDVIEAIEGDSLRAEVLANKIEELDLPVEEVDFIEAEIAFDKAAELPETLSEDAVKFMLNENFAPTIDNLYEANFGGGSQQYLSQTADYTPTTQIPEDMVEAVSTVIESAGLEVNEETLSDSAWLLEQKIPLTEETLSYFEDLKGAELLTDPEDVAMAIADAAYEGKTPGEAILIAEYNPVQTARDVYDAQMQSVDSLSSDIARQEARMMLSVEANYSLIKKGVAIDTLSIQETIDALKDLQNSQIESLVATEGDSAEQITEKANLYQTVVDQMSFLKTAPAAALAENGNVATQTLQEFATNVANYTNKFDQATANYTNKFEAATASYEMLWTSPRKDLGDSIQKAFSNVDDILEDLDLETTEANERAVRILAYNEKEINVDNIAEIKTADAQVQRLFDTLKPATVLAMIREGENPLDKSIADLTEDAQNFADQQEESTEENFAKFLWKTEHTEGITEEERESYIGLYRLIHQVEATDGAVIGAVMEQGQEVTLRNLMTAVRSRNHSNRNYTVDDDFGGVDAIKDKLSITEQIEMAYQTNCLSQAGEVLTPVAMKEFPDESSYMQLTPEGFRDALYEQLEDADVATSEQSLETAYYKEQREEVATALRSEVLVYEILERNDLPQTPAYLTGVQQMLSDRNQLYRKLAQYANQESGEQTDASDFIDQLIANFTDAIQNPEEMQKAEQNLEETAENVMQSMLASEGVHEIDVRSMKLVTTQISALSQMGTESETYHLPIMVADEVGTLTLKIVRGEEEKGLVDVAFSTEATGSVYGSFHYEAEGIDAQITFERRQTQQMFVESLPAIAESMGEELKMPITFSMPIDRNLDVNEIYEEAETDFVQTTERDEVSTRTLYGIARSFIENLEEFISGETNFF